MRTEFEGIDRERLGNIDSTPKAKAPESKAIPEAAAFTVVKDSDVTGMSLKDAKEKIRGDWTKV